jgi:hypothetical protein
MVKFFTCSKCRNRFAVPVPTSVPIRHRDNARERTDSTNSFSEYLSLALFFFMLVWLVVVEFALINSFGGCIV